MTDTKPMPVGHDRNTRLLGFARRMRHEATDAEKQLWSIVRTDRLGGFRFRRQFPLGGFILDFYCPAQRLAVELDGGQHGSKTGAASDQQRTEALGRLGVRVIRFWDHEVLKHPESVAEQILSELQKRNGKDPSPAPPAEPAACPLPAKPGRGVRESRPAQCGLTA